MNPDFKPIPAAVIERIQGHAAALGAATDPHAALAALFLLHCECKAVAESLAPEPVTLD